MPRGRNNGGHNHVLAAIADALHSANTYKGKGGGKGKGYQGGTWQGGRNCSSCNDYNFEHRINCRQCGAKLPPPNWTEVANGAGPIGGKEKGAATGWKGWQKGGGGNYKGGDGSGSNVGKGVPPAASQTPPPPTAAGCSDEAASQGKEPSERVKEIRAEEERLRRARSQFADSNPRMLATIDSELAQLSAERETLQPLEVNLQAAAGKTAHARAALAKAKEKREQAAKDLRAKIDLYKETEREVKEAEERLRAAEAAATAKRSEKVGGVQEAVCLLQKVAAEKCGGGPVVDQVMSALLQIAQLLGTAVSEQGDETILPSDGVQPGGGEKGEKGKGDGAVPRADFTACGSQPSDNKKLRTEPPSQHPAGVAVQLAGMDGDGGRLTDSGLGVAFAGGGTVEGEITMGSGGCGKHERDTEDDLLGMAAAVLGDSEDKEL